MTDPFQAGIRECFEVAKSHVEDWEGMRVFTHEEMRAAIELVHELEKYAYYEWRNDDSL